MKNRRLGFTLIELLVVLAIIALLVGILLPAMAGVRQTARMCRGMSNLRQVMLGYSQHSADHDGHLLYGYAPGSVNGQAIQITDTHTGRTYGPPVVNRYPWRLLPYVSNVWDVLYSHDAPPERPKTADTDSDAFLKAYKLSVSPTFGINSVYVGGHYSPFYKGFTDKGDTAIPNIEKHVVFREVEVQRPSSLIVFAEVQRRGGGAIGDQGHFWATAPNAAGKVWRAQGNNWQIIDKARAIGLPEGRYRNRTVVGFFDTHVEVMGADQLYDMKLWANGAKDNEYDVP